MACSLCIVEQGQDAALSKAVIDANATRPLTRSDSAGALNQHKAAPWVRVEVIAYEDVHLGGLAVLIIVTNPDLLHAVSLLHNLLDVASDKITDLLVLLLIHPRQRLVLRGEQLQALRSLSEV